MRPATWKKLTFEELRKLAINGEEFDCHKVVITPELATDMLKCNVVRADGVVGNRKISHNIVSKYMDSMLHGSWYTTKESIAFDTDMKLIDGQHRLAAIIKSNMARNMIVTLNCTSNFADRNRSRSLRENILMLNPEIPAQLLDRHIVSAIKYYVQNNKTALNIYGDGDVMNFVADNVEAMRTIKSVIDTAISNSGINCKGTHLINPAMYFMCFVLLMDYSDVVTRNDVEEFLEVYLNGRLSDERRNNGTIVMHDNETGKNITFNGSATIQNYECLIKPILFCRDDVLCLTESCSNNNIRKCLTNRLLAAMYDYKRVKGTGVQLVRKSKDCQRGNPKYLTTKFAHNSSPYIYSTELDTGTMDVRKKHLTEKKRNEIIEMFKNGTPVEQISIIVGIDRSRVVSCCKSI